MPDTSLAISDLRSAFLAENLIALDIAGASAERIRAAAPADLIEFSPGVVAIARNGGVIGSPVDEASIRQSCPADSRAPIVVFGLGGGHTARTVRALSAAPLVVYEPDPGIARALLESGPADLGDLEVVCTFHDLQQLWPGLTQGEVSATIVRTPGYVEHFPEEHAALESGIHELVQRTGVNRNTHRLRARTWVEDLLANVEALTESVPFLSLEGKYAGIPAFIVGAGPSLGKNVQLLERARAKGLVFAVNSSAKALAARGIAPQVLCCIESIDVSHLLGSLPFIDEVVRAFSLSAHPRTLRTGRGPLLPVWEAIPEIASPLERLTQLPGLAVSGSVSTLAFSLAHALGCSPIVLVGQDLAYTGQRAYAEGTPYERSSIEIDRGQIRIAWCGTVRETRSRGGPPIHQQEPLDLVPAWGGHGTVPSGPSFAGPRRWLSGAAEVLARAGADVRLVNATEGGARIDGWSELPLSEVLGELAERRIESHDIARDAHALSRPVGRSQLRRWAQGEQRGAEGVASAARRAVRAAGTALAAIRSGKPARVTHAFEQLDAVERRLRAQVRGAPMVEGWAFAPVDQALEEMEQAGANPADAQQTAEQGVRREASVARAIERAANELSLALASLQTEPEEDFPKTHPIQGVGTQCRS